MTLVLVDPQEKPYVLPTLNHAVVRIVARTDESVRYAVDWVEDTRNRHEVFVMNEPVTPWDVMANAALAMMSQ